MAELLLQHLTNGRMPPAQPANSQHGSSSQAGAAQADPPEFDRDAKQKALIQQEKNRKAQRRFRERQRARVVELEERVTELTTRVRTLMSEKTNVENRNTLLGRLLLRKEEDLQRLQAEHAALHGGEDEDAPVEGLVLTLQPGQQTVLSGEQLRHISPTDLAVVWGEYVKQLAALLPEAERAAAAPAPASGPPPPALQCLEALTSEACVLQIRVAVANPVAMKSFTAARFRPGLGEEAATLWLDVTRALALAPAQKADLVELRKLFLEKLCGILEVRRNAQAGLVEALPAYIGARHTSHQYLQARRGLDQLRANLREEHILILDFMSTLYKHILTPLQLARLFVRSAPWTPDTLAVATWAALELGEPEAIALLTADPCGLMPGGGGGLPPAAELPTSDQLLALCSPAPPHSALPHSPFFDNSSAASTSHWTDATATAAHTPGPARPPRATTPPVPPVPASPAENAAATRASPVPLELLRAAAAMQQQQQQAQQQQQQPPPQQSPQPQPQQLKQEPQAQQGGGGSERGTRAGQGAPQASPRQAAGAAAASPMRASSPQAQQAQRVAASTGQAPSQGGDGKASTHSQQGGGKTGASALGALAAPVPSKGVVALPKPGGLLANLSSQGVSLQSLQGISSLSGLPSFSGLSGLSAQMLPGLFDSMTAGENFPSFNSGLLDSVSTLQAGGAPQP